MILGFDFQDVARLSYVKRWAVIEMSRQQSVAEHSYNVAMLSMAIVDIIMPSVEMVPTINTYELRHNVLKWALIHDLPESFTGDIPTPVKEGISSAIYHVERTRFPRYFEFKCYAGSLCVDIVKIADGIDALQFAQKFCVDPRKRQITDEITAKIAKVVQDNFDGSPENGTTKDIWGLLIKAVGSKIGE